MHSTAASCMAPDTGVACTTTCTVSQALLTHTWCKQYTRSTPPSVGRWPAPSWPQLPRMDRNAGLLADSFVDAAGCCSSRSNSASYTGPEEHAFTGLVETLLAPALESQDHGF